MRKRALEDRAFTGGLEGTRGRGRQRLLYTRLLENRVKFRAVELIHFTAIKDRGDLYLIGKNTLQYGLGSIRYMGAKLWNQLPGEVRNSSSKFLFRKI